MLSRRSLVAACCLLVTFRVTKAFAAKWHEEITKWLNDAITMASVALEKIFDFALKTQTDVTLLLSIRARTGDVRRRLTDLTPEHQLNVRLAEWLKRYDRWVTSKPKPGESDPEFAARHEHT